MNSGRDCEHGRQVGKCDTCDLAEAEKTEMSMLSLIADIRKACGDNGERMQDELVKYIAGLHEKANERDALAAQVEKLRAASFEAVKVSTANIACSKEIEFLHKTAKETPVQCLAEIKSQAVLPIFNKLKAAHGDTTHPRAKVYLCEEAYELAAEVMQARAGV